jgi:hypothetical protein
MKGLAVTSLTALFSVVLVLKQCPGQIQAALRP